MKQYEEHNYLSFFGVMKQYEQHRAILCFLGVMKQYEKHSY